MERAVSRLPGLAGAAEAPSRLHGDLWSGNLRWDADRVWLVDPAAYGGHRETDLGLFSVFGAPHLERILAAYEEVWPLQAGWRERQGLHQLHPLLVHAALFGGDYGRGGRGRPRLRVRPRLARSPRAGRGAASDWMSTCHARPTRPR